MKNLRKTLSAAAIATIASKGALASDVGQEQVLATLKPGIYYHLTPYAARALKVDVAFLIEAIQLQKSQQLAFQLHEDGELNLSIYDSGVFVEVRKDIIRQAIRK